MDAYGWKAGWDLGSERTSRPKRKGWGHGLGIGMEMDGYSTCFCFVGFCFCFICLWSMYGMNVCVYIYPT